MKSFSDTAKGKKLKSNPNSKMSEPKKDEVQPSRESGGTPEKTS